MCRQAQGIDNCQFAYFCRQASVNKEVGLAGQVGQRRQHSRLGLRALGAGCCGGLRHFPVTFVAAEDQGTRRTSLCPFAGPGHRLAQGGKAEDIGCLFSHPSPFFNPDANQHFFTFAPLHKVVLPHPGNPLVLSQHNDFPGDVLGQHLVQDIHQSALLGHRLSPTLTPRIRTGTTKWPTAIPLSISPRFF